MLVIPVMATPRIHKHTVTNGGAVCHTALRKMTGLWSRLSPGPLFMGAQFPLSSCAASALVEDLINGVG